MLIQAFRSSAPPSPYNGMVNFLQEGGRPPTDGRAATHRKVRILRQRKVERIQSHIYNKATTLRGQKSSAIQCPQRHRNVRSI